MSESDAVVSALARWIKFIYVLAALHLLVIVILASDGYVPFYNVIDPVTLVFLAVSALARKSRGCAMALVLFGAMVIASSVFGFSDGDAFLKPFPYANETMWAYLAYNVLLTLAAANCARILFQFHRIAGTTIVWRNVGVASLVTLIYVTALVALGVLASAFLPAGMSDEAKGLVVLGPASLVITLAIWRKIPGTKSLQTVVAGDEDPDIAQPGTFAGDFNLISLSSSLEGTEGEDRIVSPFGAFGRSYRLTGEQYAAFLEWQKAERKKQSWMLALLFPFAIASGLAGTMLSGFAVLIVGITLLSIATVFLIYSVRKQRAGFRNRFPDAPVVARPSGSRTDKFLFGYGAGFTGKPWFFALTFGLLLFLFGLTAFAAFDMVVENSGSWGSLLAIGGINLPLLLSPLLAILGKQRFRRRYGLPLTAENLWKVRSGEDPTSVFD